MVRRRQFLLATASAIGGAAVLPQAAWPAWSSPAATAPRTLLIYDPASGPACAAAVSHARRGGVHALPLEGDPGALWYRSIAPLLEQDTRRPDLDPGNPAHRAGGLPMTITGLTPHAAFFVLSTLASVMGMRASSRLLSHEPSAPHLEWKLFFPPAASLT
jgi:hypothetical protein